MANPSATPLTLSFTDVPAQHNQEDTLTFGMSFSDVVRGTGPRRPGMSNKKMKRILRSGTSGATIVRASRTGADLSKWKVWARPTGNGLITVAVGATTDCNDSNALCTFEAGRLESGKTLTIAAGPPPAPPQPLVARFKNPKSEHDGHGTSFTIDVEFDQKPQVQLGSRVDQLSALRGAFATENALVRWVRRVYNDRLTRRLTVYPKGPGPLTITLSPKTPCSDPGAVCTAEGQPLAAEISHTVLGLPELSVGNARASDNVENATLEFEVTLTRDPAPTDEVTVEYTTNNGSAMAVSDFEPTRGTLTFSPSEFGPGETSATQTVRVPVIHDQLDEGTETMNLALWNPTRAQITRNRGVGYILNHGHMPKAWVARFAREAAMHGYEAATARFDSHGGAHVTVAGITVPIRPGQSAEERAARGAALLERLGDETATASPVRGMTAGDALRASAFQLSSGTGEAGDTAWTAWGRVSTGRFEGAEGDMEVEGDVTSFLFGADAEHGPWLGGIALGMSRGKGDFELLSDEHANKVESVLNVVYPYARIRAGNDMEFWGVAGMGSGELKIEMVPQMPGANPGRYYTDMDMVMGALGGRGEVLRPERADDLSVKLRADALWVRATSDAVRSPEGNMEPAETNTGRLRLALETTRTFEAWGGRITPTSELGARYDAGDAETGVGVEMGAGIAYASGALTIEASGHMLLVHEDSDYEEWGASAAMRLAPGKGGRGLALALRPSWGAARSTNGEPWPATRAYRSEGAHAHDGARLEAEVGYGVRLRNARGLVTPFAAITLDDAHTWRAGAQWRMTREMTLGVEASGQGADERALGMRWRARF